MRCCSLAATTGFKRFSSTAGRCLLIVLMLSLGLRLQVASAQSNDNGTAISSDEYWLRMAQTEVLLALLIGQPDPVLAEQLNGLWVGVESVRLADESIMAVDVSWMQIQQDSSNVEALRTLLLRVEGLLDYHERETGERVDRAALLAALERILAENPVTPQPSPDPTAEPDSHRVSHPLSFGGPGQLILIALGIMAAGFTIFYVMRTVSVQRVAISQIPEGDEDPTTSEGAQAMAHQSEETQDYRAAIRYLYLATLLFLAEQNVIHYDPTLTNQEHLAQVADQPATMARLRPVIQVFDDVWYGFAPVDAVQYQHYIEQVEQLKQIRRVATRANRQVV